MVFAGSQLSSHRLQLIRYGIARFFNLHLSKRCSRQAKHPSFLTQCPTRSRLLAIARGVGPDLSGPVGARHCFDFVGCTHVCSGLRCVVSGFCEVGRLGLGDKVSLRSKYRVNRGGARNPVIRGLQQCGSKRQACAETWMEVSTLTAWLWGMSWLLQNATSSGPSDGRLIDTKRLIRDLCGLSAYPGQALIGLQVEGWDYFINLNATTSAVRLFLLFHHRRFSRTLITRWRSCRLSNAFFG